MDWRKMPRVSCSLSESQCLEGLKKYAPSIESEHWKGDVEEVAAAHRHESPREQRLCLGVHLPPPRVGSLVGGLRRDIQAWAIWHYVSRAVAGPGACLPAFKPHPTP